MGFLVAIVAPLPLACLQLFEIHFARARVAASVPAPGTASRAASPYDSAGHCMPYIELIGDSTVNYYMIGHHNG